VGSETRFRYRYDFVVAYSTNNNTRFRYGYDFVVAYSTNNNYGARWSGFQKKRFVTSLATR
jgi:hypothetical protein